MSLYPEIYKDDMDLVKRDEEYVSPSTVATLILIVIGGGYFMGHVILSVI